MEKINTLYDAYQSYLVYLQTTCPSLYFNLNTALIRYTLPGYGLGSAGTVPAGIEDMRQLPLRQFVDALQVQQRVFEQFKLPPHQRRSHRYMLNRMLKWCSQQDWWTAATRANPGKYAPPIRSKRGAACKVRLTQKRAKAPYKLQPHEVTDQLRLELAEFAEFMTSPDWPNRPEAHRPIVESSFESYRTGVFYVLGWLCHCQAPFPNIPCEQLSLKLLDDQKMVYRYLNWLEKEREVQPATKVRQLCVFLNVRKFLHHETCNPDLNYRDIPSVEAIRKLTKNAAQRTNVERLPVDLTKKVQTREELIATLQVLAQECRPKYDNGKQREPHTVAWSVQRYLIVGLIVLLADRQRTIRELEVGKTLVKEDGEWLIVQTSAQYKTGKTYGTRRLPFPKSLYPMLELWLNELRATLHPTHNFVFTCQNGKPLNKTATLSLFENAIYRVTGKKLNPHEVRHITISHFKRKGASDAQMNALAELMAHSRRAQDENYDRRSKPERVAPAIEMMWDIGPTTQLP